MAIGRRHRIIFARDADPSFGIFKRFWNNGGDTFFFPVGPFWGVKAKPGLAVFLTFGIAPIVRTVANNALGRENGSCILIKRNFGL